MPTIALRYERDEIASTFQYGCLVEGWEHVAGNNAAGSKQRKYKKAFTPEERAYISKWHTRFRKWHLVSGVPTHIYFRKPSNIDLLQRAIHFFATV